MPRPVYWSGTGDQSRTERKQSPPSANPYEASGPVFDIPIIHKRALAPRTARAQDISLPSFLKKYM